MLISDLCSFCGYEPTANCPARISLRIHSHDCGLFFGVFAPVESLHWQPHPIRMRESPRLFRGVMAPTVRPVFLCYAVPTSTGLAVFPDCQATG